MSYPGGKNGAGVYQTLINLMPPHEVYVEPFLGGGAVMRLKRPAALNIGIDRDEHVITTWKKNWGNSSFVTSGDARSRPGPIVADSVGGSEFQFQCGDGIGFLQRRRFTGRELVYCDPPYLRSTRTSGDLYKHEMSDRQHARLLHTIKALPCMVMISGYWSQLYADELCKWHSTRFTGQTRGGPRTEWVWYNFQPESLHDYTYLGQNFRERERIKRKKRRWVVKLSKMQPLERQALLSAVAEAWNLQLPTPSLARVDKSSIAYSGEPTRSRRKRDHAEIP